jgi:transposase InsO family protein
MLLLREHYPIQKLCEVLGVPRSSAYYEPRPDEDRPLLDALIEVAGRWPTYGYRRLTKQLQREGHAVNFKRVRRLMHELGIVGKAPERKPRTTDSGHAYPRYANLVEDLTVTRPDEVWVADITYIRLRKEFVYLAVLMDVYTRCIRGWHLGRGLDQELTLTALRRACEHGRPEIHHSDQGVQYAATAYVEMLKSREVKISMANVGEAHANDQGGRGRSLGVRGLLRRAEGPGRVPRRGLQPQEDPLVAGVPDPGRVRGSVAREALRECVSA